MERVVGPQLLMPCFSHLGGSKVMAWGGLIIGIAVAVGSAVGAAVGEGWVAAAVAGASNWGWKLAVRATTATGEPASGVGSVSPLGALRSKNQPRISWNFQSNESRFASPTPRPIAKITRIPIPNQSCLLTGCI